MNESIFPPKPLPERCSSLGKFPWLKKTARDSREGDPLAHFRLPDEDIAESTRRVMKLPAAHCLERVVSVMEGGSNGPGLVSAVEAHGRAYFQEG